MNQFRTFALALKSMDTNLWPINSQPSAPLLIKRSPRSSRTKQLADWIKRGNGVSPLTACLTR